MESPYMWQQATTDLKLKCGRSGSPAVWIWVQKGLRGGGWEKAWFPLKKTPGQIWVQKGSNQGDTDLGAVWGKRLVPHDHCKTYALIGAPKNYFQLVHCSLRQQASSPAYPTGRHADLACFDPGYVTTLQIFCMKGDHGTNSWLQFLNFAS
jgi:hypothetical protein